jgi:phosphoribosylglycinamide formyltransferase-1
VASLHERIKVVERDLLVDVVDRMVRFGWTQAGRQVRLGRAESAQAADRLGA